MRLLIRLVINAIALYAAVYFVPGIDYDSGVANLLLVALIFGLVNAIIRPLLKGVSCPVIILTLGLFTLVINALMLWLTGALAETFDLAFHVDGFGPAFLGGIVVSIVSIILSIFLKDDD